jgi:hypothetical protein
MVTPRAKKSLEHGVHHAGQGSLKVRPTFLQRFRCCRTFGGEQGLLFSRGGAGASVTHFSRTAFGTATTARGSYFSSFSRSARLTLSGSITIRSVSAGDRGSGALLVSRDAGHA